MIPLPVPAQNSQHPLTKALATITSHSPDSTQLRSSLSTIRQTSPNDQHRAAAAWHLALSDDDEPTFESRINDAIIWPVMDNDDRRFIRREPTATVIIVLFVAAGLLVILFRFFA